MKIDEYMKMPLYLKVIGAAIGITFYIVYSNSLMNSENKNRQDFFEKGFSTTVVSSKMYQGRSMEFHLNNGLNVYFVPPGSDKIMIGDSIQKQPNTYLYNVYHKNDSGFYNFFATYDFRRFY
jgi:hypothetical protein